MASKLNLNRRIKYQYAHYVIKAILLAAIIIAVIAAEGA